jgi:hypothetical protein
MAALPERNLSGGGTLKHGWKSNRVHPLRHTAPAARRRDGDRQVAAPVLLGGAVRHGLSWWSRAATAGYSDR